MQKHSGNGSKAPSEMASSLGGSNANPTCNPTGVGRRRELKEKQRLCLEVQS